ncbi:MAG: cell division protein ZapA [Proteobacteria bacterium]|nr:cell division protein ZapA [Pseudomonadota bacterium]
MEKKVEVNILNQPFTFIGEDEDRIRRAAQDVDERLNRIVNDYGIVNTMNAIMMAMMELTDEIFEIRAHAERFEGRTLSLLKRVEEL